MDLPKWFYLLCYVAGALIILIPECIAAFSDKGEGDTITEMLRSAMTSPLLYLLIALLLWGFDHLVLHDTLYEAVRKLWKR